MSEAGPGSDEKGSMWKDLMQLNPNVDAYGSGLAEFVDYCAYDNSGTITNTIIKGDEFTVKVKIKFYETIQDPIFELSFKNMQGTEITGTNTLFEGVSELKGRAGTSCRVIFTQRMDLQGGEYLLSFGCTGYQDGAFTVYHRLDDACNITVVSEKNTVGYYDMNSEGRIENADQSFDAAF